MNDIYDFIANSPLTWKNLEDNTLNNYDNIIQEFKNFLSNDIFTNKTIIIVSHAIFIQKFL